jgi:methyl-accepting chemotaxis protein
MWRDQEWLVGLHEMPVFIDEVRAAEARTSAEGERVEALVQLLRSRSYEEIRQRMYDSAPGSAWWAACKTELELRNGQQVAEASVAMARVSEKMKASTQHFEQLAETLHETTRDLADLLRGTQEAGRRLEIAVYVTIGVTLVQLFNLIFEVFRKR